MNKQITKIFSEYGKKGGKSTAKKHGTKHFQEMQKKSVAARKKAMGISAKSSLS